MERMAGSVSEEEEGTFQIDLIQPLVRYRWPILISILLISALVFAWRQSSPQLYAASLALAPANSTLDASSSLSRVSGLGGLASLGLGNVTSKSTNYDRFIYLISSPELANWQIQHHDIRPMVFPGSWDAQKKTWRAPDDLMVRLGLTHDTLPRPPTAYELAGLYASQLTMTELGDAGLIGSSGMVKLTYTDTDPVRASQVLRYIVSDANQILRSQSTRKATLQADYLRDKLSSTSVQDYRDTLLKLLSEQDQMLMLAKSNMPFAAEPIAEGDLSAAPVPKRSLLFAMIAGVVVFSLSYFVALMLYHRSGGASTPAGFSLGKPRLFRRPLLFGGQKAEKSGMQQ